MANFLFPGRLHSTEGILTTIPQIEGLQARLEELANMGHESLTRLADEFTITTGLTFDGGQKGYGWAGEAGTGNFVKGGSSDPAMPEEVIAIETLAGTTTLYVKTGTPRIAAVVVDGTRRVLRSEPVLTNQPSGNLWGDENYDTYISNTTPDFLGATSTPSEITLKFEKADGTFLVAMEEIVFVTSVAKVLNQNAFTVTLSDGTTSVIAIQGGDGGGEAGGIVQSITANENTATIVYTGGSLEIPLKDAQLTSVQSFLSGTPFEDVTDLDTISVVDFLRLLVPDISLTDETVDQSAITFATTTAYQWDGQGSRSREDSWPIQEQTFTFTKPGTYSADIRWNPGANAFGTGLSAVLRVTRDRDSVQVYSGAISPDGSHISFTVAEAVPHTFEIATEFHGHGSRAFTGAWNITGASIYDEGALHDQAVTIAKQEAAKLVDGVQGVASQALNTANRAEGTAEIAKALTDYLSERTFPSPTPEFPLYRVTTVLPPVGVGGTVYDGDTATPENLAWTVEAGTRWIWIPVDDLLDLDHKFFYKLDADGNEENLFSNVRSSVVRTDTFDGVQHWAYPLTFEAADVGKDLVVLYRDLQRELDVQYLARKNLERILALETRVAGLPLEDSEVLKAISRLAHYAHTTTDTFYGWGMDDPVPGNTETPYSPYHSGLWLHQLPTSPLTGSEVIPNEIRGSKDRLDYEVGQLIATPQTEDSVKTDVNLDTRQQLSGPGIVNHEVLINYGAGTDVNENILVAFDWYFDIVDSLAQANRPGYLSLVEVRNRTTDAYEPLISLFPAYRNDNNQFSGLELFAHELVSRGQNRGNTTTTSTENIYTLGSHSDHAILRGALGAQVDFVPIVADTYKVHIQLESNGQNFGEMTIDIPITSVDTPVNPITRDFTFTNPITGVDKDPIRFQVSYVANSSSYAGHGHTIRVSTNTGQHNLNATGTPNLHTARVTVTRAVTTSHSTSTNDEYRNSGLTALVAERRQKQSMAIRFFKKSNGHLAAKMSEGENNLEVDFGHSADDYDWQHLSLGNRYTTLQRIQSSKSADGLPDSYLPTSGNLQTLLQGDSDQKVLFGYVTRPTTETTTRDIITFLAELVYTNQNTDGEGGDTIDAEDVRAAVQAIIDANPENFKGEKGDDGEDGTDGNDGDKGDPGEGVPAGGTTGQRLEKIDGTNYNTRWVDPSEISADDRARLNKVDGIEAGAEVNPTNLEIVGAVNAEIGNANWQRRLNNAEVVAAIDAALGNENWKTQRAPADLSSGFHTHTVGTRSALDNIETTDTEIDIALVTTDFIDMQSVQRTRGDVLVWDSNDNEWVRIGTTTTISQVTDADIGTETEEAGNTEEGASRRAIAAKFDDLPAEKMFEAGGVLSVEERSNTVTYSYTPEEIEDFAKVADPDAVISRRRLPVIPTEYFGPASLEEYNEVLEHVREDGGTVPIMFPSQDIRVGPDEIYLKDHAYFYQPPINSHEITTDGWSAGIATDLLIRALVSNDLINVDDPTQESETTTASKFQIALALSQIRSAIPDLSSGFHFEAIGSQSDLDLVITSDAHLDLVLITADFGAWVTGDILFYDTRLDPNVWRKLVNTAAVEIDLANVNPAQTLVVYGPDATGVGSVNLPSNYDVFERIRVTYALPGGAGSDTTATRRDETVLFDRATADSSAQNAKSIGSSGAAFSSFDELFIEFQSANAVGAVFQKTLRPEVGAIQRLQGSEYIVLRANGTLEMTTAAGALSTTTNDFFIKVIGINYVTVDTTGVATVPRILDTIVATDILKLSETGFTAIGGTAPTLEDIEIDGTSLTLSEPTGKILKVTLEGLK